MVRLKHALHRLQLQRSALSRTLSGALSLCSPQQAAYALSSDGSAASAPADSSSATVSEHPSVAQASPADSESQAGSSEGSCAALRHAPGIKDATLAKQDYQNQLRRPAGSSGPAGRAQCRSFSAQALPSKQSDEAEPLGFVRGGYSVEQFPPDKVCHPLQSPDIQVLQQPCPSCQEQPPPVCSFSGCDRTTSISSACIQSWEKQWHASPCHACCR